MDEIYLRYYAQNRSENEIKQILKDLSKQQNQLLNTYITEGIDIFKKDIVNYICLCRNINSESDKSFIVDSVEELFILSRIYPYLIHPVYDRIFEKITIKQMITTFAGKWIEKVVTEDFVFTVKNNVEKTHYFYTPLEDSYLIYL